MTIKTIPVRAEIVVSVGGRTRTMYIAGPKEKATMTVYGDVPGEIILRTAVAKGPESAYDGVSHLTLDTEGAQALCLELLERLGPFPALLERLGVADEDLRGGPSNEGTLPEPAKAPDSAAWTIDIQTYVVSKANDRIEYGYCAKKGDDTVFDVVLGECNAHDDVHSLSTAAWEEFAWVRDALRVATGWSQEIIVEGNAIDGLSFIGPFLHGQAKEYAGRRIRDDWVVADLSAPEEGS